MDFDIVQYGPNVFFVGGEIDLDTSPLLYQAIEPVLETGGPIFLDFSAVSFIDSSGMHALVRAAQGLRSGCVAVHGAHPQVRKVFNLTRIGEFGNMHVIPCEVAPYPIGSMRWPTSGDNFPYRLETLRLEQVRLLADAQAINERSAELCEQAVAACRQSQQRRLAA